MKYVNSVIVLFVLVGRLEVFGAGVVRIVPKNCIEKQVLDLATKWQNGAVSYPVPTLKVVKIKSIESFYEGFGIKITYSTGDMQLRGLNNFGIKELSVSTKDLSAATTISFPLLSLTSDNYSLKGRAYMMYSLKGSGFLNATFQNVQVKFGTGLVPKGSAIQVDDVNVNFNVGSIQVDLADSSWPINKVLNTSAMSIVESYRSTILTAAKDMVKQIINDYLKTTTSSEVLNLVDKDYCTYSILP